MGAAIITHCDAAPVFEPPEGVFDFVALFVERLVVVMLDLAVPFRLDPPLDQGFAEPVGVIAAIAGQRAGQRKALSMSLAPL